MKFPVVPVVLSFGGAFLFVCNASAGIQFDLDLVFDGTATPPANPAPPWITASFEALAPNQALFTLEATANLTGTENVRQFYFNFDDSLDLGALSFTHLASTGAFELPSWTFSENGLKADGDGKYDVRLDFAGGSITSLTLNRNESVSYLLTYSGPETISLDSFNFLSLPAGGNGPFLVAAHVQNTVAGGSAWLAPSEPASYTLIPEPAGASLLGLAALAALGRWTQTRR